MVPHSHLECSAEVLTFQQFAAADDTVSAMKVCKHSEMAVSLEAGSDWEGL